MVNISVQDYTGHVGHGGHWEWWTQPHLWNVFRVDFTGVTTWGPKISIFRLPSRKRERLIFFNPLLYCNFLLFLVELATNWYIRLPVWLRNFLLLSLEAKQAWMWKNISAEYTFVYSNYGKRWAVINRPRSAIWKPRVMSSNFIFLPHCCGWTRTKNKIKCLEKNKIKCLEPPLPVCLLSSGNNDSSYFMELLWGLIKVMQVNCLK